jgi:FkbM family methyltransferase
MPAMKLSSLAPEFVRAFVRRRRYARRNAGFTPTWVRKTLDGASFDFLLGDVTGHDWYAALDTLSPELVFTRDRMVQPGDVVLECGAHHGFTTLLIAQWAGPAGRVVAFEASPASAAILSQNVERNGLTGRVTVEARAVGAAAGMLTVTEESNAVALTGRSSPGIHVPVVPLDAYADLDPTLIKLDVEGFEIEALRGARRVLERRPRVAIEVHVDMLQRYGSSADALFEFVRPEVYALWIQPGGDQVPRPWRGERLADLHMDQVHLYAIPK